MIHIFLIKNKKKKMKKAYLNKQTLSHLLGCSEDRTHNPTVSVQCPNNSLPKEPKLTT